MKTISKAEEYLRSRYPDSVIDRCIDYKKFNIQAAAQWISNNGKALRISESQYDKQAVPALICALILLYNEMEDY